MIWQFHSLNFNICIFVYKDIVNSSRGAFVTLISVVKTLLNIIYSIVLVFSFFKHCSNMFTIQSFQTTCDSFFQKKTSARNRIKVIIFSEIICCLNWETKAARKFLTTELQFWICITPTYERTHWLEPANAALFEFLRILKFEDFTSTVLLVTVTTKTPIDLKKTYQVIKQEQQKLLINIEKKESTLLAAKFINRGKNICKKNNKVEQWSTSAGTFCILFLIICL